MSHKARRDQTGTSFRQQAEANEWRGKARIVRCDHMVAMHQHGGTDTDRIALHGGNERQFAARQCMEKTDDR